MSPDSQRTRVLAILTFGHANTHWFLGVMAPILPLIAQNLNLTFTQVGFLLTLRALGASLGSATAGVISDVLGKRKVLLVSNLALMGALYASMGYAHSLAFLMVPFFLTGSLNSGWHPPAMSAISHAYPTHRGFALGVHGSGATLIQSFAPLLVGYLLGFMSWRGVMKWHLFPPLISAVLVFLILPPISMETSGSVRKYSTQLISGFRHNRAILGVAIVSCLRTMSYRILESFLPLYLAFHFGMNPAWVGFYIFLLMFSGTIPESLTGLLSDRLGRKWVLVTGLVLSSVCLTLIPFLPAGAPLGAAIAVLGFSLISLRPIIMALGLDVTPPELGGSAIGFLFSFNQIFAGAAPLAAGVLADWLGLGSTFIFTATLTLASAVTARFLVKGEKWGGKIEPAPEVI
jgi:MFS family permease